ncbi:MAG: hypothetical protein H6739_04615 [Alphaproteobacteria bacterium]|nr:hypothetical protein [Alphaproteobacteria bacterium]
MSSFPTARAAEPDKPRDPGFLRAARAFYGNALDVRSAEEIGVSMRDWSELSEAERSYIQTHLLYLNLKGMARTQRMLEALLESSEDGSESLRLLSNNRRYGDDDELDEGYDDAEDEDGSEPPEDSAEGEDDEDDGCGDDEDEDGDGEDGDGEEEEDDNPPDFGVRYPEGREPPEPPGEGA